MLKPGNLRCVKFDSMLPRTSPTKGVPWDPRGSQCRSNSPSPHPLSSHKLKKTHKLPSHWHLPASTTFHFLPPRYIFAPISPSSLFCTSPLCQSNRSSNLSPGWRWSEPFRRLMHQCNHRIYISTDNYGLFFVWSFCLTFRLSNLANGASSHSNISVCPFLAKFSLFHSIQLGTDRKGIIKWKGTVWHALL